MKFEAANHKLAMLSPEVASPSNFIQAAQNK